MNNKEVTNKILEHLSLRLGEFGFKINKGDCMVKRKSQDGSHVIIAGIADYRTLFRIRLSIGIRIDEVEDIFHEFSGVVHPKYYKKSFTSVIPLSYFIDPETFNPNYILEIRSLNEISTQINKNLNYKTRQRILDFFDDCLDIKKLEQYVNGKIGKEEIFGNPASEIMHGLILKYLTSSKDELSILIENYKNRITDFAPFEKENINNLMAYLINQKILKDG